MVLGSLNIPASFGCHNTDLVADTSMSRVANRDTDFHLEPGRGPDQFHIPTPSPHSIPLPAPVLTFE